MTCSDVKNAPTAQWYVISIYADCGDFEILTIGSEIEARNLFQRNLGSERNLPVSSVRNITDYQYEIWVEQHYQNSMEPGLAYTVKLLNQLPRSLFH